MSEPIPYSQWRKERFQKRESLYDTELEPGLLSFVTTVWDTPVEYLRELVDCLKGQVGGTQFEWVILDNGSSNPQTSDYLREIGREDWIQLYRVEENLGIIKGMRFVLEKATGRYVLPLDSDDLLSSDCAKIFTWFIKRWKYPPLLYSDEDKVRDGEFFEPYIKTDWDPVLFVNSCYIAHMGAISREIALELDAYSDDSANGSHDWDTFTRFVNAGHTPKHVPEVTYTWRVHSNSTSGNIDSKSYIHSSQRAVLSRFIDRHPKSDLFKLEYSPFFRGTPDWWIRRKHEGAPSVALVEITNSHGRSLSNLAGSFPVDTSFSIEKNDWIAQLSKLDKALPDRFEYFAFVHESVEPEELEWIWDAIGQFELFGDVAAVGGRVVGANRHILHAGAYFGFGWGMGAPEKGKHENDPSYFAFNRKHRTVDAIDSRCMVISRDLVREFLSKSPDGVPFEFFGEEIGIVAKSLAKRIVYSPFLRSLSKDEPEILDTEARVKQFNGRIPKFGTYPRSLSVSQDHPYMPEGHPS